MTHETNCIFCKIARGEAPAVRVYEDDQTLAFMDISPASEGHTLVVSKMHFPNLLAIDTSTLTAVTLASQRLACALDRALQPDGIRVSQFNGAAAGQTVFHYHVHLIPIRQGQQVGAHGRSPADPEALAGIAARIRAAVG
jgi:histidine triad (HIT) family protein